MPTKFAALLFAFPVALFVAWAGTALYRIGSEWWEGLPARGRWIALLLTITLVFVIDEIVGIL